MLFAPGNGGGIGVFFKVIAEMGGFGKTEQPGYFLDGGGGVLQEGFGLGNRFLGYPGADGLAGFAFDDIAQVIGVQVLRRRVILYAEDFFLFAAQQVAVMFFEVSFERFYDVRAAVAFIDGVVVFPEVFFDLEQHYYEQVAYHPVPVRRIREVFFVYLPVELFESGKHFGFQHPRGNRFGQQEGKFFEYFGVYVFFQEGFAEGNEVHLADAIPFE